MFRASVKWSTCHATVPIEPRCSAPSPHQRDDQPRSTSTCMPSHLFGCAPAGPRPCGCARLDEIGQSMQQIWTISQPNGPEHLLALTSWATALWLCEIASSRAWFPCELRSCTHGRRQCTHVHKKHQGIAVAECVVGGAETLGQQRLWLNVGPRSREIVDALRTLCNARPQAASRTHCGTQEMFATAV